VSQTAGKPAEAVEGHRSLEVGATRATAENVPGATAVVSRRVTDQVTVGSIAAKTGVAIEVSAHRSPRCHPGSERRSSRGVGLDLDRGLEKRMLTSAPGLGP
jgi:hypothetical protein